MKLFCRRIFSFIMILSMTICACAAFSPTAQAQTSNQTALSSIVQKYEKGTGSYTLSADSRFFIVSDSKPDSELKKTVSLVASEFAKAGYPGSDKLSVVYGAKSKVRSGDIVVQMKDGYSAEHYKMVVKDSVWIYASDTNGVFYGLRTLLKYFIAGSSKKLACCTVKDGPDVAERCVHLDCARKYYSPAFIKRLLKQMSWMGYNAIEIHFSEDQGLRLQSKKFPWLAGAETSGKRVYTQAVMAELCKYANNYHIEVIPSFDSPGHMDYIVKKYAAYVKKHPSFKFTYNGKTYSKKSSGFSNISNYQKYKGSRAAYNYRGIDLANPTARAFAAALQDEYADFFKAQGCTKFNIGGDELLGWSTVTLKGRTFNYLTKWYALQHWDQYAQKKLKIKNGNAVDTFISYMNSTATRLEKKGYTVRAQNDEINRLSCQHVALKKSIRLLYWNDEYRSVSYFQKKGYKMYNGLYSWCYYVIRKSNGKDIMKTTYKYVNGSYIYNHYKPKSFAGPGQSSKYISASQYSGAYFFIWSDHPNYKTANTVWKELRPLLWANSVKMWNTQVTGTSSGNQKALSYTAFKKLSAKFSL